MNIPDIVDDLERHVAARGSRPLHQQVYERIAAAVLDGRLPPGVRLPSARSLAAQLSVARGTVDTAYQRLAGEGYVVTQGAAGTRVDPALDTSALPAPRSLRADDANDPLPIEADPGLFRLGLPALDAFPRKVWTRLAARQARSLGPAELAYQSPAGDPRLRVRIARYLAIARGIDCLPEQIVITGGFQGALGLISRCLLNAGDPVWVEDPGYRLGRDALRLAGARPIGVPVDDDGFEVSRALADAEPASMALVTPTHQFPLGVTLSLKRRMALLKWASSEGGWIVEDDYDSEFRYQGRPIPALKSLDRSDRVLYAGTFSKILAPGLRVGYLVLPRQLVGRVKEMAALVQPPPSPIVQGTIAEFMERGHLARHIRRMRTLYAQRRAALADALVASGESALGVDLQPGGMHFIARLRPGVDDVAIARRLESDGIEVIPLSACAIDSAGPPGFLIGFTNVPTDHAFEAAHRLVDAFGRAAGHSA